MRINLRSLLLILIPMEAILLGLYLYVGEGASAFWFAALGLLVVALFASRSAAAGSAGQSRVGLAQVEAVQVERQRLQANLDALLGVLPVGVAMVDARGEVLLHNEALAELFAISPQVLAGGTLSQFLRQHQFVELWRQAVSTGDQHSQTEEVPHSRRVVRAAAHPLSGPLAGHCLLLFQDMTELRRLETVRKDFVSNVSHELRTPLTSLKALTESLRAGALEEPETAQRFLGHMETEVDALSELVAELLELARIESHQVPLQLQASDAGETVQRAVDRLALQAQRAGLELQVDCPPDLPSIQADSPRLEQMLVNLIHNAVKFTPGGGRITVSAERVGDLVQFQVADTGVGIDPDALPRIFERFFKTDPARNQGGTGLGLAICKHLAEAHGGRIWAESQLGQGSRFFFTIPVSPAT